MNFMVMHFLDMVDVEGVGPSETPTCGYWNDDSIDEVLRKIKVGNGQWSFKLRDR
ncbi:hypothetical protein LINGRAHAP2_LOCUS24571, partial [Linum grandiflorum]